MTPEQIDRVFGRGRLKMVTGAHVEVFREAATPGESCRYTKRFLTTAEGDYAQWTEREWRILARLIGHGSSCVPDIVQYDRGAHGTKLVQTYDAGTTIDQWATILPVERDGRVHAHVFEDCAHWWALAHHCLVALDEIHSLELVHLDIKGDNICIPVGPANFDPALTGARLFPVFRKLALIDFAFSLVSGEKLTTALPIGWQQDYDYQSPRLLTALEAGRAGDLSPTEALDWRCDMYSLAAMLKRYLPSEERLYEADPSCGWTGQRYDAAKALILRIREAHDRDLPVRRPHGELVVETSAQLRASELHESLEEGWTLAHDAKTHAVPALPLTPVTRLAPPIRSVVPPRDEPLVLVASSGEREDHGAPNPPRRSRHAVPLALAAGALAAVAVLAFHDDTRTWLTRVAQSIVDGGRATAPNAVPATTAASDPGVDAKPSTSAASEETTTASSSAPQFAEPAPPAAKSAPPIAAAPTESAAQDDESLASKIESYRPRSASRPARSARVPTIATGPAPHATSPVRASDSSRRDRASAVAKSTRQSASATTLAARTPKPPASKRRSEASVAAVQRPSAASSARAVEATAAVANVAKDAVIGSAATARPATVAAAPSAPIVSAPAAPAPPAPHVDATPPATAAAAPSVASPVTPPRTPTETSTPAVEATAAVANVTKNAVIGSAATARPATVAAAPSAPIVSAPAAPAPPAPHVDATPPATAAAAPSVASPVTPPRTPTETSKPVPGMAPIVEASRPFGGAAAIPAPRIVPPVTLADASRSRAVEVDADAAYLVQARRLLVEAIPRTSTQAYVLVARVLWIAEPPPHPAQERAVISAAGAIAGATESLQIAADTSPADARRLHAEARRAYTTRGHVPEAFDLALKAFGANPNDPEVAGHLASLHLKMVPGQPERARQLALHAIGLRAERYPAARTDDWTTLAVASALTGRQPDARNALYASLVLTRDLDRLCRAALGAYASFGERLRDPVESMLYRLHVQRRTDDSPNCASSSARALLAPKRESGGGAAPRSSGEP